MSESKINCFHQRFTNRIFNGLVIEPTGEILRKPVAEITSDSEISLYSGSLFADDFEKFRDWLNGVIDEKNR
jgi:hypothetical protein